MICSSSPTSSCEELTIPEKSESSYSQLNGLVTSFLCTSVSCSITKPSSTLLQPFFRPSIFSNIPPTIHFYVKGNKVEKPPNDVEGRLLWCHNSLLPVVMRQCLSASHFTIVNEEESWIGYWGRHLRSNQFRTLRPYQKVNHIPGAFHMGRKDQLWQHVKEMISVWGNDEYQVVPTTYILPAEFGKLRAYLRRTKRSVIIKPPASARGTGICITNRINQVPRATSLVAQHYIHRPLIVNNAKFDLRLYVYITCFDPLRIYLYHDGLVRFASVPYSFSSDTVHNHFMHLTNYSINKFARPNENGEMAVLKWKLTSFWDHISSFVDVNALQKRIVDIIIKAVIACETPIRNHQRKHCLFNFASHELYGMDIIIDNCQRPWLLEVNISPSLNSSTSLDVSVKAPLARDVLNLCGIQVPAAVNDEGRITQNYSTQQSNRHKTPTELQKEIDHMEYYNKNKEINPSIVNELTGSDARALIEFEDELKRTGGFHLIYPKSDATKYLKYFKTQIYSNLLLMRWQVTQSQCSRKVGIEILEEICARNGHISTHSVDLDDNTVSRIV